MIIHLCLLNSLELANFKAAEYVDAEQGSACNLINELDMHIQLRAFLASLYVIQ